MNKKYRYLALWNAGDIPPREVGSIPTVSTIKCDICRTQGAVSARVF
jgi:hypothetical protein